ncbi:MAG TPA: LptF/LptG family permease, partial [Rhodobacteraceae bacterium]|nr:LptF/LptG family permease [Paracoccaceae bacterium]
PRRHQIWFQSQLASPLFLVAMLMIAAAFTMRHTRLGQTGLMALIALLFGFGIYFIRNFATILGENGQIPVSVAAWTPPIAGVLLALGIILHLEDG